VDSSENGAGDGHASFLTRDDEMGLAEAQAMQTDDSVPDTLEVHSDSLSVMQDSVQGLKRPARMIAIGVGVAVAVVIALGVIGRARRGELPAPGG
jgi:hypothetical protein